MQTSGSRIGAADLGQLFKLLTAAVLILFSPLWVHGQEKKAGPAGEPVAPQPMADSIRSALSSQRGEVQELQTRLEQLEDLRDSIENDIKAFESRNTAHNQLLLVSRLRMDKLEDALKDNRLTNRLLDERIEKLQNAHDTHAFVVQQTADLIALARKQIGDITESQLPDDQKQKLTDTARELLQVLNTKRQLAERIVNIHTQLLNQVKQAREKNQSIGDKLASRLEDLKHTSLLTRYALYDRIKGKSLAEALDFFQSRVKAFFDPAVWKATWRQVAIVLDVRWAFVLLLLVFLAAVQGRCRRVLKRLEKQCEGPDHTYRRLGLQLLNRSVLLLSLTLLFGIYSAIQLSFLDIGLRRFLYRTFLLLLITRWGLDFLKLGLSGPPTAVRAYALPHMRRLLRFSRTVGLVFILLIWINGMGSLPVWIAGNLLGLVLLAWNVRFWRSLNAAIAEGVRVGEASPGPKRLALLKWWSHLVIGSGLLLNLFGYDMLAVHLTAAWIKTVVLLFLGWITLQALREWRRGHRSAAAAATDSRLPVSVQDLRWSLIQLVRLTWFFGLIAGIIWAWDRSGFLVSQLGRFLQLNITIGSLRLSAAGLLIAVVLVFITYLITRIGRSLLDERVLEKRQLERGLRDSILTIASYLTWGLGLVLVLGSLGVNTTSLAVVFGALSIGIGFGLQNIFNNFISGLILLFERPIQVGDYVEVGGLWAEVKKIQVRATVVQTFDNAAVIIPNSEFISQRVTNWSFKDQRMRRNLEVGVAYGSDIDLVQKTMLDIALASDGVMETPKPDVIFVDHADSALIFRLRIWVHVDNYFQVPSRIRSEIDRRFRQLGIEIAFPQRDLHIRSLPEDKKPDPTVDDTLLARDDQQSPKTEAT